MGMLRGLCIAAAVFCVLNAPATGNAAEKILKLASFVPPVYILHKPIFEKLAADLDAATGGSVKIQIYPSGELGKGPVEQYKRVVSRIAEIVYGIPGYTSSIFPRTLLIELPGISNGHQDATAKLWKVMDAHLRSEFKKTVPLALFVTPPAILIMRDKPVRNLPDLAGMKIRVPSSSAASVIESYGATPVPMPANKVYTAMSTGVIDGVLMGSPALLSFKLIETAKYVTTNLPEMPTAIYLAANAAAYNELSPDERRILDRLTGLDISQRAATGLAKLGRVAMAKFAKKAGAETIVLGQEARAAFDAKAAGAVAKLRAKLEAKGIPAGDIIAAMVR